MADAGKTKRFIEQWDQRISSAETCKKRWEEKYRVAESYQFWTGNQLAEPMTPRGQRKIQINLIHSAVRAMLPSLYFYRPFARISAAPEQVDTPGTALEEQVQILQDTGNYFVREGAVGFRENTFIALKESLWAIGCVEVGHTAEFIETVEAPQRPPIKESEWTKVEQPAIDTEPVKDEDGLTVSPLSDEAALEKELERLRANLKSEDFYVKHIPARQLLISETDRAVLLENDWIGYWEEHPLEDIKRSSYENTKNLKASTRGDSPSQSREEYESESATVRIYKIWDLRTRTRFVMAEGHDKYLLRKPFKRCPLKLLRFDLDPYHFFPKPPIASWLMPQEEYNDSREYLRVVRSGTKPLFTVDEQAMDDAEVQKLELGDHNAYVKRRGNTTSPIEPVNQPNYSQNALQTLTISEREFNMIAGVPAEFRQSQVETTATQATIMSQQAQIQDSYDRSQVAEWLATVIHELLDLALDHMLLERWIEINVDPDSPFATEEASVVATRYQQISAQRLQKATRGIRWAVQVDVETLSPVSEEQKLTRWMQALTMITNPQIGPLLAMAPSILKRTLELSGIKSGRDADAIREGLNLMLQQQQAMASQQAEAGGSPPKPVGTASQPGRTAPGAAANSPAPPASLPNPPSPPSAPGAR